MHTHQQSETHTQHLLHSVNACACCVQARLAQSAERKALNLVVVGSSPTVGVSLVRSESTHRKPLLSCLCVAVDPDVATPLHGDQRSGDVWCFRVPSKHLSSWCNG